jgi:hypothetical protein
VQLIPIPDYTADATRYKMKAALSWTKREVRQRVLSFIHEHHSSQPMRFFSLPGHIWAVERRLATAFPNAHFVGVDWSQNTIALGASRMPGPGQIVPDERAEFGLRRDRTTFLQAEVSELAVMCKRSQKVKASFGNATALWIDACGTLRSVLPIADSVSELMAPGKVPVLFTFSCGRERSKKLRDLIARTKPDDRVYELADMSVQAARRVTLLLNRINTSIKFELHKVVRYANIIVLFGVGEKTK